MRKVAKAAASTGKKAGTVKVSWKAAPGATGGYRVYVCAKKGGKAVATKDVAAGRTSVTVGGLKRGKSYYVKVRPMRKASGTAYAGVERYCASAAKAR